MFTRSCLPMMGSSKSGNETKPETERNETGESKYSWDIIIIIIIINFNNKYIIITINLSLTLISSLEELIDTQTL